jgi:hypothetical protein
MEKATESEPPSCSSVFMIGQDSRGNWIVRDQSGLRGGVFVGRAEALRYVRSESGNRARTVVMVNGSLELNTNGFSNRKCYISLAQTACVASLNRLIERIDKNRECVWKAYPVSRSRSATRLLRRGDRARGEEALQAGNVFILGLDGAFESRNILHQALGGQA